MKIIFFSTDIDTTDEFQKRHNITDMQSCYDLDSFKDKIEIYKSSIIIIDYDTVANELNKLISSNTLADKVIVLEKRPEIATGKMLISHNIKAYGNIKMLNMHYIQIIQAVKNSKVWTYPELTMALIKRSKQPSMSEESSKIIEKRLTEKEKEVVYLILEGLTNLAIASKLNITVRTVKAHISSIFSKLHINDRISLVLLLR